MWARAVPYEEFGRLRREPADEDMAGPGRAVRGRAVRLLLVPAHAGVQEGV